MCNINNEIVIVPDCTVGATISEFFFIFLIAIESIVFIYSIRKLNQIQGTVNETVKKKSYELNH